MPKGADRTRRANRFPTPSDSDLEDEVDKFHKEREKLHLDVEEDALSDEDFEEENEAVLDVHDASDEDSDEFDTDEEMERETRYGKCEFTQIFSVLHEGNRASGR